MTASSVWDMPSNPSSSYIGEVKQPLGCGGVVGMVTFVRTSGL